MAKYSVTYQGESGEWIAVRVSHDLFAVSPPAGKSFEDVKIFLEDLKEYLGL